MKRIRMPKERMATIKLPKTKLACVFQVEKFKADGTITYKGPKFHNTILDVGLDAMATDSLARLSDITRYCVVGTGSSTPSTSQGGLDAPLAQTANILDKSFNYQTSPPAQISYWRKWEFVIGSCTGNLTEVGLSEERNLGNTSKVYFNRQLFRDETGSPIVVTVDSDEGLRVDGEVFLYSPLQEGEVKTGSFLLNGSTTINYSLEMDISKFILESTWTNYQFPKEVYTWLSDVYDGFCSDLTSGNEVSGDTYFSGTFKRSFSRAVFPGDFVGTVRRFVTGYEYDYADYPIFYYRIDTPFDVASDEELTINFETSWGRLEGIYAPAAAFYHQGGGDVV